MGRRRNMVALIAERQSREVQRGVKMGFNQLFHDSASISWVSPLIPIGTDDFTIEYFGSFYGSGGANKNTIGNFAQNIAFGKGSLQVYSGAIYRNNIDWIQFEGTAVTDGINLAHIEIVNDKKTHLVISRSALTVKVYINGILKATKVHSSVKDFPEFRLGLANSSDISHARAFNYALSQDEVTSLYNDGTPGGYVVPAIRRGLAPIAIKGVNVHTWTGVEGQPATLNVVTSPASRKGFYKINVTVSNYVKGSPRFLFATASTVGIPAQNGTFDIVVQSQGGASAVLVYGSYAGVLGSFTIAVNSVTPLGLIAEFIPQNIQPSKLDPFPFKTLPGTGLESNSFTWDGVDSRYSVSPILKPFAVQYCWYIINITVSNFEAGNPFIYAGASYYIPAANGTYDIVVQITNPIYIRAVPIYGGANGSDRRLTLTVNSVIAIDRVGQTWFDSASQLPLNGEYLPPMLQSAGGFDMVANGTPEILLKP